jgi:hypothetical protein
MKKSTGKYLINLVLINFIFILNSCIEYKINWRNYSSYTNTKVIFSTQNDKNIKLNLNNTRKFRVSVPIEFINFQQPNECDIVIYPFFDINNESEVYFFDINILFQDDKKVIVESRQCVEAYYAKFYINDLLYYIISKDNELIITEPQELMSMDKILLNINNIDYTYVDNGRSDYNGYVFCGYIVRSKIDDTILWLGR